MSTTFRASPYDLDCVQNWGIRQMTQAAFSYASAVQLELFAWLAAPCERVKRRIERRKAEAAKQWEQLQIQWLHDAADEDDDPLVTAPIIHRTVKAEDCKPIAIAAPASIFNLCGFQVVKKAMGRKPSQAKAQQIQQQVHLKVSRQDADGITRVTRMHHTETDEWQEREAVRRAKQVVPKPQKQNFEYARKKAWV